VAGYLVFEQPSGEDLQYIQARAVVSRYRFGQRGDHLFDTALYVEYYLPDPQYAGTAKEKVEVRLILEKNVRNATLAFNPKFEKVLSGPDVEEGMEFEYGASLYARGGSPIRPGVELYGKLGELVNTKSPDLQEHYVVPAVKWKLTDHLGWNLGAAVGLTDASDDLVIKSILEWNR
ncbi:MAG: hypothetical protein HY760_05555, partial [Nitrospirae bacterium]|nr:hypothetical protein [Nitrospirota bacterium]